MGYQTSQAGERCGKMAKEGGDRVRPSQANRGSRPEGEAPTFPESVCIRVRVPMCDPDIKKPRHCLTHPFSPMSRWVGTQSWCRLLLRGHG